LKKLLRSRQFNWKTFEVDGFEGDPIPRLQEQIRNMLDARQNKGKNKDFWSKGKVIIEKVFTALCPLTKSLLLIAKNVQAVYTPTLIQRSYN
jgi:hypothetical protein